MANVRLNDDLRAKIITSACSGLTQQIVKIESEIKAFFPADRLYRMIVPSADIEVMKGVPAKYFKQLSYINVKIEQPLNFEWTISPDRTQAFPYPDSTPRINLNFSNVGSDWATIEPMLQRRKTLAEEKVTLKQGLETLLKKCVSLKQVIAIWPTVLMHVPASILEEHNKKAEKRSKELAALDPALQTALTKSAILAK
jgi:hypothetical protein